MSVRFSSGQFKPSGQISVAFVKAQLLLDILLVSTIHCTKAVGQAQRRFCLVYCNLQMVGSSVHLILPGSSTLASLQELNKWKLTNLCPKLLYQPGKLSRPNCDVSH